MLVLKETWCSQEILEPDNCENSCKQLQDVSSIHEDDFGGKIKNCIQLNGNPLGGETSAPIG